MLDLIFEYMENHKANILNILRTSNLYLSKENGCRHTTLTSVAPVPELITNQEEADSCLILNAMHALQDDANSQVVIKAISADTDIFILALFHLCDFKERVILDTGTTVNRKLMLLSSYELSESHRHALIGFHAFTGNDYNSSFLKYGKPTCWKTIIQNPHFVQACVSLGDEPYLPAELFSVLEEYVCKLYKGKGKNISDVRYQKLKCKHDRENKFLDLSLLPSYFFMRIVRAVLLFLWKRALSTTMEGPELLECGWNESGDTQWVTEIYPGTFEEILFEIDGDNNNEIEFELGSEDEEECM